MFAPARKTQARARVAIIGAAGSGKTMSALRIARGLVGPTGRIAVIDTERRSASKYADVTPFDSAELEQFSPESYIKLIKYAEEAGYHGIVIDSASHEWEWCCNEADRLERNQKGNKFTVWSAVSPKHDAFVGAIVGCRAHVIVTMRAKVKYIIEADSRGRQAPKKIGMKPIQRDSVEYEFDVVLDCVDIGAHRFVATKSRCRDIDGQGYDCPGEELGERLAAWLSDGAPAPVVVSGVAANDESPPSVPPPPPPPPADDAPQWRTGGERRPAAPPPAADLDDDKERVASLLKRGAVELVELALWRDERDAWEALRDEARAIGAARHALHPSSPKRLVTQDVTEARGRLVARVDGDDDAPDEGEDATPSAPPALDLAAISAAEVERRAAGDREIEALRNGPTGRTPDASWDRVRAMLGRKSKVDRLAHAAESIASVTGLDVDTCLGELSAAIEERTGGELYDPHTDYGAAWAGHVEAATRRCAALAAEPDDHATATTELVARLVAAGLSERVATARLWSGAIALARRDEALAPTDAHMREACAALLAEQTDGPAAATA